MTQGVAKRVLGRRSERGDTCIHTADAPHGMAETNTAL